jgi:acetolactate synthase-1/2/3 large subunit
MRVTDPAKLDETMAEVFSPALKDRLVFLDVAVDQNEHVYPMWVRGGALRDMMLSKTERS